MAGSCNSGRRECKWCSGATEDDKRGWDDIGGCKNKMSQWLIDDNRLTRVVGVIDRTRKKIKGGIYLGIYDLI